MSTHFRSLLAALAMSAGVAIGQGTLEHPTGMDLPMQWRSGIHDNQTDEYVKVSDTLLEVPDATWTRVFFSQAVLDGESFVRFTSLKDGETQDLNAADLEMWSFSSAYFNGGLVAVELFAAPGSRRNSLTVDHVSAALGVREVGDPGQCGICGADDRTPTSDNWTCRLMPVGCTGTVYCRSSAIVTAGHCMGGSAQVVHFNVPASQANCDLVAPPVADQFPILAGSQSQNAGVGADWGVFNVGTNNLGQTPYHRYGVTRPVGAVPGVNQAISFRGFGIDTTCVRNQTQQLSSGTVTGLQANYMTFNADVRGGNSGSGVINAANTNIVGIVTHCTTNCPPNYGTRIDLPAFVTGRTAVAPACNGVLRQIVVSTSGAAGVAVQVGAADVNNLQNGSTNFMRVYGNGAVSSFTAPAVSGGACFQRWVLNGTALAGNPVNVTMSQDHTLVAEYGSCGPGNDACGSAIDVSAGGQFSGTLVGATNDGTANCGSSSTNADVWYVFNAPANCASRLTVSTCGTNDAGGVDTGIDTVLAAFQPGAAACAGAQLACNDDWGTVGCVGSDNGLARDSYITLDLAAGQQVKIRVSKFAGTAVGPFTLNVRYEPANNACANALPIGPGTTAFNTCAATTDGPSEANCAFCCGDLQINNDLWYAWTAPANGTVVLDTEGSLFDTKLGVYAGVCPAAANTAIACDDDAGTGTLSMLSFNATAGITYVVRVGGFTTARGAGLLNFTFNAGCDPDVNCDGVPDQDDVACIILAVAGDMSCFCQTDPDFNGDGVPDQGDVADVILVVAGAPCP